MDEDSGALGPLDHDVRYEPIDVLQEDQLTSVPDMSIVQCCTLYSTIKAYYNYITEAEFLDENQTYSPA
jgi:hypothetical protein